jgi:hypothetical protein
VGVLANWKGKCSVPPKGSNHPLLKAKFQGQSIVQVAINKFSSGMVHVRSLCRLRERLQGILQFNHSLGRSLGSSL